MPSTDQDLVHIAKKRPPSQSSLSISFSGIAVRLIPSMEPVIKPFDVKILLENLWEVLRYPHPDQAAASPSRFLIIHGGFTRIECRITPRIFKHTVDFIHAIQNRIQLTQREPVHIQTRSGWPLIVPDLKPQQKDISEIIPLLQYELLFFVVTQSCLIEVDGTLRDLARLFPDKLNSKLGHTYQSEEPARLLTVSYSSLEFMQETIAHSKEHFDVRKFQASDFNCVGVEQPLPIAFKLQPALPDLKGSNALAIRYESISEMETKKLIVVDAVQALASDEKDQGLNVGSLSVELEGLVPPTHSDSPLSSTPSTAAVHRVLGRSLNVSQEGLSEASATVVIASSDESSVSHSEGIFQFEAQNPSESDESKDEKESSEHRDDDESNESKIVDAVRNVLRESSEVVAPLATAAQRSRSLWIRFFGYQISLRETPALLSKLLTTPAENADVTVNELKDVLPFALPDIALAFEFSDITLDILEEGENREVHPIGTLRLAPANRDIIHLHTIDLSNVSRVAFSLIWNSGCLKWRLCTTRKPLACRSSSTRCA
jgi:hypothetical protein